MLCCAEQALTWPDNANYGLQKGICRWISALPLCHKAFLRGEDNLAEQLKVYQLQFRQPVHVLICQSMHNLHSNSLRLPAHDT